MTHVDFYILPDQHGDARDHYACQLAEEAYRQGRGVLIQALDAAHAAQLDGLLWRFRDSSFIPHALLGSTLEAPVEIGYGDDPGAQHDLLINLANGVPGFFSRFERVCEIVVELDTVKTQTREHYRYYQEHGYPLHHHQLRQRILSH